MIQKKRLFVNFSPSSISYVSATCEESSSIPNPDELMPVTRISDTNLFTGIFYKIVLKSLPQGLLTWADRGKYLVQYELTESELPKYNPNGPYKFDHQWVFDATESSGAYTLTNRAKPFASLIWNNDTVGHGTHVAIYDDDESRRKVSKDGEWRKSASWLVRPTCEEDYYKIENLEKQNNFLTWTLTKYNEFNFFMQLCKDFDEDSKFSFQPVDIKLDGYMYDFVFQSRLESFLSNNESDYSLEKKKYHTNPTFDERIWTIEETVQTKDSIAISLNNPMISMQRTSVLIEMLTEIGVNEFSFEGGFDGGVEKRTEITKTFTIKKRFMVPPRKIVEANISTIWARNVELPFEAKMEITGRADRMVVNHPDVMREGPVPPEVVQHFIRSSGVQMEFINTNGVTIVYVHGVLKGNFGLQPIVKTRTAGKFSLNIFFILLSSFIISEYEII